MKKILIPFFILISAAMMAQSVVTLNPGRNVIVSNLAIASIGGADTSFKFRLDGGCDSYSIQIVQKDTIETVATSVWFYGTNDGTGKNQIGDTVILAKDAATQNDFVTGTTFPYDIGILRVPKYTVSDGDITIILYYRE